jgi:hypothetical protein
MINPFNRRPLGLHFFFLLAVVLHMVAVLALRHYEKPRLWENGAIASNLWSSQGFNASFSRENEPTSWQAPAYPYLLYYSYLFLGPQPSAYFILSLLQAIATATMVYPMAWLTHRWFGRPGLLYAALLTCLMPLYCWYSTRLHHTAFVMTLHPWLVWAWLKLSDKTEASPQHLLFALFTGLTTGVAGLFQPVLLAPFGLLSGWGLGRALFLWRPRQAGPILLAGLCTLLVLTPWTVRNYHVHHRLILIKNSFGKEFWMGNNPHATGTSYAVGGKDEITHVYPPQAMQFKGQVSEMELMNRLSAEAWSYIKQHPFQTLQLSAKKFIWFWTLSPKNLVRSSGEAEALAFRWGQFAYWVLFVLLAAWAAWRVKHWPREYLAVLALYAILYSSVYALTHVGQARFRGEIEFLIIPAVAAGLVSLKKQVSAPQS